MPAVQRPFKQCSLRSVGGDQQDRLKDQEEWELNWAWSSIVSTKTLPFDSSPYAWRSVVNWDRMLMTTSAWPRIHTSIATGCTISVPLAPIVTRSSYIPLKSFEQLQHSCDASDELQKEEPICFSRPWTPLRKLKHRAKIMETLLVDGLTTMPLCRLCITMQYAQIFLVSSKFERQELRGDVDTRLDLSTIECCCWEGTKHGMHAEPPVKSNTKHQSHWNAKKSNLQLGLSNVFGKYVINCDASILMEPVNAIYKTSAKRVSGWQATVRPTALEHASEQAGQIRSSKDPTG